MLYSEISEADWMDDGGDYVEWDEEEYDDYEDAEEFELLLTRKMREGKLHGKYLITTKSKHNGKVLYLQDRNISTNGWWTYFKSNALGFDTKHGAEKIASKIKYNNPRVVYNV